MFFAEPPENAPTVAIPGWTATVALTFGVVVTIVARRLPAADRRSRDEGSSLVAG